MPVEGLITSLRRIKVVFVILVVCGIWVGLNTHEKRIVHLAVLHEHAHVFRQHTQNLLAVCLTEA